MLEFRLVSEETWREYVRLFSLGHSASSAHHHFEEDILHEGGQSSIADCSTNPGVHWVHHFYRKWRTEILGSENGKNLFERLEQEVEKFNERCDGTGGCAKIHWYSIEDSDANTDEDNEELQLPKPKK